MKNKKNNECNCTNCRKYNECASVDESCREYIADLKTINQVQKKRIAELENRIKDNVFYSKGYAQGIIHVYLTDLPDILKQFAERLKEKAKNLKLGSVEVHNFLWVNDIDETLNEFINE